MSGFRGLLASAAFGLMISLVPAPGGGATGGPIGSAPAIELVTFSPGDDVWSRFGHIGLRIVDPASGSDMVYDYGHARFENLGFVLDYVRQEALFFLAARPYEAVVARYRRDNRTVTRQALNLTAGQASAIRRRLAVESRPQNRNYVYDQITANCSTRLRDLIDECTGGALSRAAGAMRSERTYRSYTLEHGAGSPALQFVLDLISGPRQDRVPTPWEALYVPMELRRALERTRVEIDGASLPLAGPPEVVFERVGGPSVHGSNWFARILFLGICAGTAALLSAAGLVRRRPRVERPLAVAAGIVLILAAVTLGLLGAVEVTLVTISTLVDFGWNQNVFAFVVTDLGLVWVGVRALRRGRLSLGRFARVYLIVRLAVIAGLALLKVVGAASVQDNWVFLAGVALVLAAPLASRPGDPSPNAPEALPTVPTASPDAPPS